MTVLGNPILLGGSGYELLGSGDYTLSVTSTTASQVASISCGSSAFTSGGIIYVKVRDRSGPRAGYFLGSDAFFMNCNAANGSANTLNYAGRIIHRYSSASEYGVYASGSSTGYGIYGHSIDHSGNVFIYGRYNSNYTLTINGTYAVEVYLLKYAPYGGNPFNYTY